MPHPPVPARPVPPLAPELEDCCRSGCVPCVFDLYEDALARYQEALAAWEAAQPPGSPPCLPSPSG
ncbi:oxidoreductase-like domain-containing protein [Massilia sp. MS-15]|uniref:oxidoreductase-like domain-containing protein n=1 Tax=Massilia sp. MS-15 TaxID=2878200 RepID=UPI001CD42810|nr:oxidoreductase-like domain-containing protein [Massilia sp. MS-15]